MSTVLLVSTNALTEPFPVFPLGMATVAAILARAGHEVRQWDLLAAGGAEQAHRDLAEVLRDFRPDVVGFSLRNIDTADSTAERNAWWELVRSLVDLARNEFGAFTLLGGPAFSLLPEDILTALGAHCGVKGEAEGVLPRLMAQLEAGEEPSGVWQNEGLAEPQSVPAPLAEPALLAHYAAESGVLNVQTKRGCPHHCGYCSYPLLEGRRVRPLDPEAAAEHMARLHHDYPGAELYVTDSIFNDQGGEYLALAEILARLPSPPPWSALFRPQGMDRDALRLLKRAGLRAMELGTDAATDQTMAGLHKRFTFSEVLAFHQLCTAEDLPVAHFIIFGGPGETMDTVREGLANIKRLTRSAVFAYAGIRILPHTAVHRLALEQGVIAANDPLLDPRFYFSPHIAPAEMGEVIAQDFRRDRSRVFPPSDGEMRSKAMRSFGFRGLLWDRLIRA